MFARGARHRAVKRNLPIYMTEFGISSKPPARKFGLSLANQAREINRAEFAAYRNRLIRSYAQFQLSDDTNIPNFKTGLRFGDNSPKPSFDAFRMPIYPLRKGNGVQVWGGVRPGAGQPVADPGRFGQHVQHRQDRDGEQRRLHQHHDQPAERQPARPAALESEQRLPRVSRVAKVETKP